MPEAECWSHPRPQVTPCHVTWPSLHRLQVVPLRPLYMHIKGCQLPDEGVRAAVSEMTVLRRTPKGEKCSSFGGDLSRLEPSLHLLLGCRGNHGVLRRPTIVLRLASHIECAAIVTTSLAVNRRTTETTCSQHWRVQRDCHWLLPAVASPARSDRDLPALNPSGTAEVSMERDCVRRHISATSPPMSAPRSASAPRCRRPAGGKVGPA